MRTFGKAAQNASAATASPTRAQLPQGRPAHPAQSFLQLQRAIGNGAVQRLVSAAKDDVTGENAPKADQIAQRIMRMGGAASSSLPAVIQSKCAQCEQKEESAASTRSSPSTIARMPEKRSAGSFAPFQAVEGQDGESPLFTQKSVIGRKAESATLPAAAKPAAALVGRVAAGRSVEEPLPAAMANTTGNAFGYGFPRVPGAVKLGWQLGPRAPVQGDAVDFGQGPVIQRVANWAAGTVHQTNSLANSVVNGAPVGFTPPMLNGTIVLSTAATRTAMKKPTLAFSSAAGGVDAKVATVATNTGSFDETVLAAGPWSIVATKAAIGAMLPLPACTGAGNSTFRAIGDPNDAAMFTANRRHEDHHATDHHTAFDGSILAWDTKLTVAAGAGTNFHGATEAAAETALYAAMGGTPDQVADAYFNEAVRLNNNFHATPKGGNVGPPTGPTADATCSTSSANYFNPS